MPPRPLLAVLPVVCALLAAPARAQDQSAVDHFRDTIQGVQKNTSQKPADWTATAAARAAAAASYDVGPKGERAAAVAFVDFVRKFPDQRMEYCAFIVRRGDGRLHFSDLLQGDMDKCPSGPTRPGDVSVAMVHTHPIWGDGDDPHSAGQVFSDADFAAAEWEHQPMPIYLGAPAGHILRYAPGGTSCKGSSWIIRDFEIVRDLRPSVRGRLPINPGVEAPLFDMAGRPIPKPDYCRAIPRGS